MCLTKLNAQDSSSDKWIDSGDVTTINLPTSDNGRVDISKGYSPTNIFGELLRLRVPYSSNNYMSFRNATLTGNNFVPAIFSYNGGNKGSSLFLLGVTNYASDIGSDPLINFDARKYVDNQLKEGEGAAITTRPLFAWRNYTSVHMQMLANGNLGLGTTNPQAQLHTTGTVRFGGLPSASR